MIDQHALRRLRAARGWSQADVALAAAVPLPTYRDLEQGRTLDPAFSTALSLARALGVDCSALARPAAVATEAALPKVVAGQAEPAGLVTASAPQAAPVAEADQCAELRTDRTDTPIPPAMPAPEPAASPPAREPAPPTTADHFVGADKTIGPAPEPPVVTPVPPAPVPPVPAPVRAAPHQAVPAPVRAAPHQAVLPRADVRPAAPAPAPAPRPMFAPASPSAPRPVPVRTGSTTPPARKPPRPWGT